MKLWKISYIFITTVRSSRPISLASSIEIFITMTTAMSVFFKNLYTPSVKLNRRRSILRNGTIHWFLAIFHRNCREFDWWWYSLKISSKRDYICIHIEMYYVHLSSSLGFLCVAIIKHIHILLNQKCLSFNTRPTIEKFSFYFSFSTIVQPSKSF